MYFELGKFQLNS